MNFLIIGNSAASTSAIEAIRKHDSTSSIVQLSDEEFPLYSRCLLSYYISNTIKKETLLYRSKDFHREMNVELYTGKDFYATRLDVEKKEVICKNNRAFSFDRLLICTGSSPRIPNSIDEGIEGIFAFRNIADAERILEKIPVTRTAVVMGGGLIGIKTALALNTAGIRTFVVARSNYILSQMIDPSSAQIVSDHLREQDIQIFFETDVSEVLTRNNKLAGVRLSDGKIIDCEILVAAKGVSPNTGLIDGTSILKDYGILTDAFMRTSNENIFAAGDVAQAFDIVLEKQAVNALWTSAVQQGRIAGLNMVGQKTSYNGAIGMNSLNIGNLSLISFGITHPIDDSQYKVLVNNQPQRNIYKKVVIGADNRIKGIILLGNNSNAGVLLSLIQRKTDVSLFEEELLDDRFNFGKLLKYGGESEMDRYYKGMY